MRACVWVTFCAVASRDVSHNQASWPTPCCVMSGDKGPRSPHSNLCKTDRDLKLYLSRDLRQVRYTGLYCRSPVSSELCRPFTPPCEQRCVQLLFPCFFARLASSTSHQTMTGWMFTAPWRHQKPLCGMLLEVMWGSSSNGFWMP